MPKKFIKIKILAAVILLAMLVGANLVNAAGLLKDEISNGIDEVTGDLANTAGYNTSADKNSALLLVQTVINIFLSVIGVLLLAFILYAGYHWLTAKGDEEKVKKAQDTIERAVTGIIIIIAAYAISVFVMSRLEAGTLEGGGGSGSGFTASPSR
jgi:amino acid transporter